MAKNRNRFQPQVQKENTVPNQDNLSEGVKETTDSDPGNDIVNEHFSTATDTNSAQADQGVDQTQAQVNVINDPETVAKVNALANGTSAAQLYKEAVAEIKSQEPVNIPAGFANVPPIPVDPYQLPLSCSNISQMTIQELKEYISKMKAPIRMPSEQGGQYQMNLYHSLMQAINSKPEDFDAVFGLTMRLIHDNQKPGGVFSDENMHRYTPYIQMPSKAVAHFRYLLATLTALANPAMRKYAARQVNIDKAFRVNNIKEDARQRVLNYFNM